MPSIEIEVTLTVGSQIGRSLATGHAAEAHDHHTDGWPLGWGSAPGTAGPDGREIEAVVLMAEPALPGPVAAWPIGVLRLDESPPRSVLVCVAEEEPFMGFTDLLDHTDWNAAPEEWLHGFRRVHPDSACHVAGYGGRAEAVALVADAERRHDVLRSAAADVGRDA